MMLCDTPCSQTMNDPPLYHVPRALRSRTFSDLGHCFRDLHLALGGPLVNVTDLVIFDLDSDTARQPAAGHVLSMQIDVHSICTGRLPGPRHRQSRVPWVVALVRRRYVTWWRRVYIAVSCLYYHANTISRR